MTTIAAGTTQNTGYVATVDSSGNLVFQTNGTTTALTLDTAQNANIAGRVTATGATINGTVTFANSTGNTFNISSAGIVGIGTNVANNTTMHIVGDWVPSNSTVKIQSRTANLAGIGFYNSAGARLGIAYSDTGSSWFESAGALVLNSNNGGSGTNIYIAANGNVGIANSTPGSPLTVQIPSSGVTDGLFYSGIMLNRTGNSVHTGIRYDSSGAARWRAGITPNNNYQIARFDTSNTAYDDNFSIDNVTGTVNISTPSGAEPFTQLNVTGTSGNQIGGILISGVNQAHVRFQTGNTSSWGGTNSKRWQLRAGNGSNQDNISFYSWTKSADVLVADGNGCITMPSQPRFFAIGSSGGTYVQNSNWVFPTTLVNSGNYSTSTGRFTAPVTGTYVFFYSNIGGTTNEVYRYFLYKNGSVINGSQLRLDTGASGSEYGPSASKFIMINLNINDYVNIFYWSDGGTASYPGTNDASNEYPTFGGYLIA